MKADGVALPEFGKTFQQYRAIQAKVESEANKTAEKLAEGTAATVIEAAVSTIPGIGPLVSKLGGMGAEVLVDWLRGFLSKPDIDLLLDPAKKLTADFLTDLAKAASKRRIVLMLDTFEQMSALDDWAREIAQRLPANTLLVIAGRALPNWDRAWPGWMANAHVEELKPMNEDDMRELIRRYYATLRGGEPDPKQVKAIIRFARGLPMAATMAMQLWVKYGVEDFQAIKPESVANLVDRLMDGVPKEMMPALAAAAIVPWFNQPILRAVMAQEDVRDAYNELRRFPFVRTRLEGLTIDNTVREVIKEAVRLRLLPEKYQTLLERAITYYRTAITKIEEYKGGVGLTGAIDATEKSLRDALGDATFELGLLYVGQGRWYDALHCFEESLAIRRQNNDLNARADTIYQIARVHHLLGNLDKARTGYRDALRLYQHMGNAPGIAACETGLGRLMIQMGLVDDALRELNSARQIYRQLGDEHRIAEVEKVLQVANHIKEKQPA